jgi:FkbM family methyltransferase
MRRKWIESYLRKRGLCIASIEPAPAGIPPNGPTLAAALERLKARAIPLGTVLDVGASDGRWSEQLLPYYPTSRYLCVEAQPAHEPALKKFTADHPNIEFVLAAAGASQGSIYFNASDLFGGVASTKPVGDVCITVPVTTLDAEVKKRSLPPPYLIKLDTHGFEVPILAGAAETLIKSAILIIEAYNFQITDGSLYFHELCQHLGTKGFRCIDLFDPLYRPSDGALWQMDLMFARADRPEFQYKKYQ